MRKLVYLFLALMVPGLIFVFLKYAGSNRFEVPVYPLPGASIHPDCGTNLLAPYYVPDSAWHLLPAGKLTASIVVFPVAGVDYESLSNDIKREMSEGVDLVSGEVFAKDSATQSKWKSCVFLLQPPQQSVLLDSLGRIRGQYDLRSREEVDRLRVETKILRGSY